MFLALHNCPEVLHVHLFAARLLGSFVLYCIDKKRVPTMLLLPSAESIIPEIVVCGVAVLLKSDGLLLWVISQRDCDARVRPRISSSMAPCPTPAS